MADPSDEALAEAEERGRIHLQTAPRAKSARYDAVEGRMILELVNGCTFAFPPRLVQGLEDASDAEIAKVEVGPFGIGLHWESHDVDIRVEGLVAGRFGTRRYMVERFGASWNAEAAE